VSPLAAATILIAAPALVVLFGLVVLGALQVGWALLGAALALAGTVLALRPLVTGLRAIRAAVDRLEADEDAAPALRSTNPLVEELWLSIVRLARAWRERRRAREAEVAAVRAVLDGLPQPLLLLDGHRRVTRANAAASALFGAEVVERDLAGALRQPALLAAADGVLADGEGRGVDLAWSDGRHFRARLERFGAGAILTLDDVTALRRADQLRADFIANASHELRTPLATLLGFIDTLQGPARDDPEARERFLGIMKGQATRMSRLVEDLLSLSRIEMREHQAPTGRVALRPVLVAVADALALRAQARQMRIAIDAAPGLPEVVGDGEELTQLFQNLLVNAIKYGRAGTAIAIEARPGPLGVAVAVRDEGDGIPPAHLPRLTERFYRVDKARSRELGGTGLGLAIVKHIVGRHRGRLEIASELGQGSTFTVHLRSRFPPPQAGEGESAITKLQ
jgi:two-component system phosphate regulon sensor histidine kinase PhoR